MSQTKTGWIPVSEVAKCLSDQIKDMQNKSGDEQAKIIENINKFAHAFDPLLSFPGVREYLDERDAIVNAHPAYQLASQINTNRTESRKAIDALLLQEQNQPWNDDQTIDCIREILDTPIVEQNVIEFLKLIISCIILHD